MKGRRALPTAEALTGQKTAPAAASTIIKRLYYSTGIVVSFPTNNLEPSLS